MIKYEVFKSEPAYCDEYNILLLQLDVDDE
jgi:hypothetical protein